MGKQAIIIERCKSLVCHFLCSLGLFCVRSWVNTKWVSLFDCPVIAFCLSVNKNGDSDVCMFGFGKIFVCFSVTGRKWARYYVTNMYRVCVEYGYFWYSSNTYGTNMSTVRWTSAEMKYFLYLLKPTWVRNCAPIYMNPWIWNHGLIYKKKKNLLRHVWPYQRVSLGGSQSYFLLNYSHKSYFLLIFFQSYLITR